MFVPAPSSGIRNNSLAGQDLHPTETCPNETHEGNNPATGGERLQGIDREKLQVEVSFNLPSCLHLPDGIYEVFAAGAACKILLKRVQQERIDPRLHIANFSGIGIQNDRLGLVEYSHVTVTIPRKLILAQGIAQEAEVNRQREAGDAKAIAIDIDLVTDTAIFVANRLLRFYRFFTQEFWGRPVTTKDLYFCEVVILIDGKPVCSEASGAYGAGITLELKQYGEATVQLIRDRLMSEGEVPLIFDLFADASDHLDRGNYRLGVIDARTALEVLVDEVLLDYFGKLQDPVNEARQLFKFDTKKKQHTLEEIVRWGVNINLKLSEGIAAALGLDFRNQLTGLWEDWEKAKALREKAAHRGMRVDQTDAENAVRTIGRMIEEIQKKTGNLQK